jgi:hypothetical protein
MGRGLPSLAQEVRLLGGYLKNSDDFPNTRERVLVTIKHKVRALRDGDSPSRLHKFPKI